LSASSSSFCPRLRRPAAARRTERTPAFLDTGRPASSQRLFVAATELVAAVCERSRAVLLLLEDLHLAGPETMDAVRLLALWTRDAPLVLVVTHADSFDPGPDFEQRSNRVGEAAVAGEQPAVPPLIHDLLRRVSIIDDPFDEADFEAVAGGMPVDEARRALDIALSSGVLTVEGAP